MINYNNIKIFNKNGNEIPLFYTSNLIFTTASNLSTINDTDVVLYGCYDGISKTEFDAKIIQPGKIPGNCIFDTDELFELQLNCFIDGILSNSATIELIIKDKTNKFVDLSKLYSTNHAITSLNSDLIKANEADDSNYFYYAISNLSNKVKCDLTSFDDLLFPSNVFVGKIEMDKVSTGLVETETLIFGNKINNELIDLNFDDDYVIKLVLDSNDNYIKFLQLNTNTDEIIKLDEYILDANSEKYINIGFFPDTEGVYEQSLYVCLFNTKTLNTIKIGEINIISEAVGEDERYRALFDNFGILNPVTYHSLFKKHDIAEENIDWQLINQKSKELFLTYDQIFPYVGTYKALINAVKFLGYDDIYFREWFKVVTKNNQSQNVSYRINLNDVFNDEDVYEDHSLKTYKKLNKLSMIYKINQESGEYDEYDIPLIENVYDYSITEVLTKLVALKLWLERNIIAVNCKITEITGEGVIYEKQDYITYGTVMQNIEHEEILETDPKLKNRIVELIDGSANIQVSNIISSVNNYIQIEDLSNLTISDFDDNLQTFEYPFINNSIVKGYVDTSNAIINENLTKPLWVNNGELYFLPNKDVHTIELLDNDNNIIKNACAVAAGNFINTSKFIKAPIIQLQRGYIRKNELDWDSNIKYTILPATNNYSYKVIDASGNTEYSYDNIILYPMENASLEYTRDTVYDVPMFKIKNYRFILYNNKDNMYTNRVITDDNFIINDEYILDIQDGKIFNNTDNKCIINFNYDFYNNGEQNVSVIYEYTAQHEYKPIIKNNNYYYDEYFTMNVNHAGHYSIIMYSFNNNGNIFAKEIEHGCDVIINKAPINIYSDENIHKNDKLFYCNDSIGTLIDVGNILHEYPASYQNDTPIFRDTFKLKDLSYGEFNGKKYIQYPNISYAIDTPKDGDYLYLQNIIDEFKFDDIYTDDVSYIKFIGVGNKQYNSFPSMLNDSIDYVNVVIYNKLYHYAVFECEAKLHKIIKNDNNISLDVIVENQIEYSKFLSYINDTINKNNYEYYIQPITVYSLKSAQILDNGDTKLSIDNNFNLDEYENSIIFNIGDSVKLIYSIIKFNDANKFIKTDSINDADLNIYSYESKDITNDGTNITYTCVDKDGNKIEIKYYKSSNKYFYTDESNGGTLVQYSKLYESDSENELKFDGYATYKVKDCGVNFITIDNIFNYFIYDELNVLGEIPEDEIVDESLLSNISNYYIIRYKNNDNEFAPVLMKDYQRITYNEKTYVLNPIISSLSIAKAHQRYVNYTMIAKNAEEFFNSYNRVYTNDSRLYSYLDNSFSMIISKFNHEDAYNLWNYNYFQPNNLYLHKHPITINRTKRLSLNKNDIPQIVLASKFSDQKDNYTYWKVYIKQSDKSRKLLFEVMNNKLVLDFNIKGIYDIEAYNYDKYGNLSVTERESYIQVI